MHREPDTWTADTSSSCWPTVWRHKCWYVQWHPAVIIATLGVWACVLYLNAGHTKAELYDGHLRGTFAAMAVLLGGAASLGNILSLGHGLLPKFLRKTQISIGLVELPCTIGFFVLLHLVNA